MPNLTQILRNGTRLLGSRDVLLAGQDAGALTALRAEITQSWLRSMAHGVEPDRFSAPYTDTETGELAELLRLAAGPVADAVADDLAGTGMSLVMSDGEARIVDRRVPSTRLRDQLDSLCLAPGFNYGEEYVGTTAISIALSQGGPALVAAGEHYSDTLTPMVCAVAPVTEPGTGRVIGTFGLASPAKTASPLMVALVRRAAHDIERRIADSALRGLRGDIPGLPGLAGDVLDLRGDSTGHGDIPGWEGTVAGWDSDLPGGGGEVPGWNSLTPAEQSVAEIIAEGATNREAAAHLYLSRHTIDFHLRQIFRKLGIASRVELTRLVVTRGAAGGRPTRG